MSIICLFWVQHDINLVNYGSIYSKMDDKAGQALGHGHLVFDKALPWRVHRFSVRSNQDMLPRSTVFYKNGNHTPTWQNKKATAVMPNLRLHKPMGDVVMGFTLECSTSVSNKYFSCRPSQKDQVNKWQSLAANRFFRCILPSRVKGLKNSSRGTEYKSVTCTTNCHL